MAKRKPEAEEVKGCENIGVKLRKRDREKERETRRFEDSLEKY